MNPFFMFLLAIFSPMLLAISLLVPPYLGIAGAAYVIYDKPGPHPLTANLIDVFYMVDVYYTLFTSWLKDMGGYHWFTYSTPLIILPFLSIVLALWLTAKLSRKLMDIFQLGVGH